MLRSKKVSIVSCFSRSLLSVVLISYSLSSAAQSSKSKAEAMVEGWEEQVDYMIAVIDSMPEDKLDFKPDPEIRSFKELFVHAASISHVVEAIISEKDVNESFKKVGEFSAKVYDKKGLKAAVRKNLTEMILAIKAMKEADFLKSNPMPFLPGQTVKTNLELLSVMSHHIAHHRGQATIYLRLNGVTPPNYKNWW